MEPQLNNSKRNKCSLSPLHKYPSLHRVHNAAELRFLIRAPRSSPDPPGEGGCQPVCDLRGNAVGLQLLEVILGLQTLSGSKQENGGEMKQNRLRKVKMFRTQEFLLLTYWTKWYRIFLVYVRRCWSGSTSENCNQPHPTLFALLSCVSQWFRFGKRFD